MLSLPLLGAPPGVDDSPPRMGSRQNGLIPGWLSYGLLTVICTLSCNRDSAALDILITDVHILSGDSVTPGTWSVGLRGEKIVRISSTAPHGARTVIRGRGLILSPGFVDTNTGGLTDLIGDSLKLQDGVTTYLSAHGGIVGEHRQQQLLNYATTIGVGGADAPVSRLERLGAYLWEGLRAGAYGISLSPEYSAATTRELVRTVCRAFAGTGVPVAFHTRFSSAQRELEGIEEAFQCAAEGQGNPIHILHVSSTGGTHHPEEATAFAGRALPPKGALLFDMYPYTYWKSGVHMARFRPGWTARYQVDAAVVPQTGERVDERQAQEMRRRGDDRYLLVDSIPQATVDFYALRTDATLGSDSNNVAADPHPRVAGSFMKFIKDYVAPSHLTLGEALHRLSTHPARRFAQFIPGLARRGEVREGFYADLLLLDPDRLAPQATVLDPTAPSRGVEVAIVNGRLLMMNGRLLERVHLRSGKWLTGPW